MNLENFAEVLRRNLSGKVETGGDLARLTTYRLGGPAALLVEPSNVDDLRHLGDALRSQPDVPLLALGRGSNLVVSDAGWPGIVLRLGPAFSWARPGGEHGLEAGSSMTMPQLANWSARRGLAGLEWAISIPGSVGGGVRMNAGAHGGEMKDHLRSATLWRMDRLEAEEVAATDLGMSYRRTNLTPNDIVLEARFELVPEDSASIRERMEAYRKHRAETQPGALQNAGSVFKNPTGDSAGRLVESAGLKGFRVGGVRVAEKHANFFIAGEDATAQDVYDLVSAVKAKVRAAHGVELETEIKFVGEFSDEEREV